MNRPFELSKVDFTPRHANRHIANLGVSLTIPFESWQLLWKLQAVELSDSAVLCRYDISDESQTGHAIELWNLLDAQPEVHLQIETPPSDDFFCPSVNAVLANKTRRAGGLDLEFMFTDQNQDIESLVACLTDGTASKL
jgi:hypothetical protein